MNRRRLSSLIVLVIAGGGFMWLAINNLGLASGELLLQLFVVIGMIVLLILFALLAALGLRALIHRFENRDNDSEDDGQD